MDMRIGINGSYVFLNREGYPHRKIAHPILYGFQVIQYSQPELAGLIGSCCYAQDILITACCYARRVISCAAWDTPPLFPDFIMDTVYKYKS